MGSAPAGDLELDVFPDRQESLEIDEALSSLEAILKYSRSSLFLQRLPFIRAIGFETPRLEFDAISTQLVPLVEELVRDPEDIIRDAVSDALHPMGRAICEHEGSNSPLFGRVLGCALTLIKDHCDAVRDAGLDACIGVAMCAKGSSDLEQMGQTADSLLASDELADRLWGLRLLAGVLDVMVELWGESETCQRLCKVGADASHDVRKELAMQFPTFCTCLSAESVLQWALPIFQTLTHDTVWSVRQATADVLPAISNLLPPSSRHTSLLPTLNRLREDLSTWVKASALMSFGPFLTTLETQSLVPELLEEFCKVISEHCGLSDDAVLLSCAHAFPGVALKAGAQGWSSLRGLYLTMAGCKEEGVRRTLACSAHELVAPLDKEVLEEDVLPAVHSWMEDPSPAVRMGTAKYLGVLIQQLPQELHERCLSQIDNILAPTFPRAGPRTSLEDRRPTSPSSHESFATAEEAEAEADAEGAASSSGMRFFHSGDWRLRRAVASQLGPMVEFVHPELVRQYLLPCALQLCSDCVVAVREEAGAQLGRFLWFSLNREGEVWGQLREQLIGMIKKLSTSERFELRCLTSVVLMRAQEIGMDVFSEQELAAVVEALRGDAVVDVRLRVGGIMPAPRSVSPPG
ncbi:unnamed protein product [Ostreobium quekettii]|uniref:Uncharacterized protein n=1 Tax=Ostreobium quekettii TaxID=121088 RepID=A0A8S1JET2_9CHLO|nr:unnamed protein product [Ostreobium quekettii]|eukprot:evm.model.scf_624.1 EVM.evm.TU.scf_624.1   scf_624:547-4554(+)